MSKQLPPKTKYTFVLETAEDWRGCTAWVEARGYDAAVRAAIRQARKEDVSVTGRVIWATDLGHLCDASHEIP